MTRGEVRKLLDEVCTEVIEVKTLDKRVDDNWYLCKCNGHMVEVYPYDWKCESFDSFGVKLSRVVGPLSKQHPYEGSEAQKSFHAIIDQLYSDRDAKCDWTADAMSNKELLDEIELRLNNACAQHSPLSDKEILNEIYHRFNTQASLLASNRRENRYLREQNAMLEDKCDHLFHELKQSKDVGKFAWNLTGRLGDAIRSDEFDSMTNLIYDVLHDMRGDGEE